MRKSNSIVQHVTRLWSLISIEVFYALCSTQWTHRRKGRLYFTVVKTQWTVRLITWVFMTDESLSEILFRGNCFWNTWPKMICWPTPVKYNSKISTSTNLFVVWISPRQLIVSLWWSILRFSECAPASFPWQTTFLLQGKVSPRHLIVRLAIWSNNTYSKQNWMFLD